MRTKLTTATVLLVTCLAFAAKQETLQDLMIRCDSAKVDDRPGLCADVAERQLKSADELFTAGKVDEARSALKDVATFSEKAHDAAIQSGKRVKNTEIEFRKMAAKLRDIKRTVNFEDQEPIQAAADRLEALRTELLTHMFKGK